MDLDTLRPDHLGCYGYKRNTSPNLDKIAREGVRFDNYYCSDAPCLPSRTALFSGRFGLVTGVVNHGGECADFRHEGSGRQFRDRLAAESLPGFLKGRGFKTVTISPFAERHSSWSFYAGFTEAHNTGRCGIESAEEVTPTVLKWIEANAHDDNWFLHINYWDPHTPYRAPVEFGNPFKDEPLADNWITDDVLSKHINKTGPHTATDFAMYNGDANPKFPRHLGQITSLDDVKTVVDGYDCGIKYMDGHIGRLIEAFKAKDVWDDMVVIVSSDHAENMGEFGIYGEHATADYATCRIPMIIRWPGCAKNHADNALHYNLDLAPTLADMLGAEKSADWDGESYADSLKGGESGHPYLVISQCAHVCQRGVRFGDYLYIRTYHDGYHLFDKEMLFNIVNDPHEQHNIAGENRELCLEAVYYLNDWHDRYMERSQHDADPMRTVIKEGGPYHARGHLAAYTERLIATGRTSGIEELKRRHPREFASKK